MQAPQDAQPVKAAAAPGSVEVEAVPAHCPCPRPAAPDAASFSGTVPAAVAEPQDAVEQPASGEQGEEAADVAPRCSEPQVCWHDSGPV